MKGGSHCVPQYAPSWLFSLWLLEQDISNSQDDNPVEFYIHTCFDSVVHMWSSWRVKRNDECCFFLFWCELAEHFIFWLQMVKEMMNAVFSCFGVSWLSVFSSRCRWLVSPHFQPDLRLQDDVSGRTTAAWLRTGAKEAQNKVGCRALLQRGTKKIQN